MPELARSLRAGESVTLSRGTSDAVDVALARQVGRPVESRRQRAPARLPHHRERHRCNDELLLDEVTRGGASAETRSAGRLPTSF